MVFILFFLSRPVEFPPKNRQPINEVEEEVYGETVENTYYDVKYLLGGSEKRVKETFISCTPNETEARQAAPRDIFTVEMPEVHIIRYYFVCLPRRGGTYGWAGKTLCLLLLGILSCWLLLCLWRCRRCWRVGLN